MSPDNTFTVNLVEVDGKNLHFDDVAAVRIVSQTYNLLIMKDYMPTIGEIIGSVSIISQNSNHKIDHCVAYFVNHDDIFTIIVKTILPQLDSSGAKNET